MTTPSTTHDCPGCGDRIPASWVACNRCHRRLPNTIRHALALGRRVRHRNHEPLLNALRSARAWWADNRRESPR